MSCIIIDTLNKIEKSREHDRDTTSLSSDSASDGNDQASYLRLREENIYFNKCESEDCEDYYIANVWAGKLKKLKPDQRLLAEKAIHDILFEAELGNLQKSCIKINNGVTESSMGATSSNVTNMSTSRCSFKHSEIIPRNMSEVLLSEALPNETRSSLSESQVGTLSSASFTPQGIDKYRTFIVAASPSSLKVKPLTQQSRHENFISDNETDISCVATVSTNTPDCIITKLSRYLGLVYDNCKSYVT